MKSFVVPAVFFVALAIAGFLAPVSAKAANAPAQGAPDQGAPEIPPAILEIINQTMEIACKIGLIPCVDPAVRSDNRLPDWLCALGLFKCGANDTRSARYFDGTFGHPLPVEIITAARSFDDAINRLLCIVPLTCPDNYESQSRMEVPSIAAAIEAILLPPVVDPLAQKAVCLLGLRKCD